MKSSNNLDIFRVLNNLNKKNYRFFNRLTPDEQKTFQPYVVMKWLTGTTDDFQIFMINELVNSVIFQLPLDKELLYNLMCISTTPYPKRYKWIKQTTPTNHFPTCISVIQRYFEYSEQQSKDAFILVSNDDVLSFADQLGMEPLVIKKIKKELKQRL